MIDEKTIAVLVNGKHVVVPSFEGGRIVLRWIDDWGRRHYLAKGINDDSWFSTEAGGFVDHCDIVPLTLPRTVCAVAIDTDDIPMSCHIFATKEEAEEFMIRNLTEEPDKWLPVVREKGFFCDEILAAVEEFRDNMATYAFTKATI
jgi:hypothetical protein